MAGIARTMKRHGLTTKPSLRLVSAVRSGDTDYYMFDVSGSGKHYTIAKPDFWRGAHGDQPVPTFASTAPPVAPEAPAAPAAAEPEPRPEPIPATPVPLEQVRARDLAIGDVVNTKQSPEGKRREIVRVVPGTPTCTVHYVYEGTAALRSAKHPPGTQFILRKRASS